MRARTRSGSQPRGSIRIIGGEWRSRRITLPAGTRVRPTPDRVRETAFNWLSPWLPGARCLDLYAGSGALGIEALSRGAASVIFVEQDRRLVRSIGESIDDLGGRDALGRAELRAMSAEQYLRAPTIDDGGFDIAFLDPPYELPVADVFAGLLPRMRARGHVYVERSAADSLPEMPGAEWIKTARAGAVRFGVAAVVAAGE